MQPLSPHRNTRAIPSPLAMEAKVPCDKCYMKSIPCMSTRPTRTPWPCDGCRFLHCKCQITIDRGPPPPPKTRKAPNLKESTRPGPSKRQKCGSSGIPFAPARNSPPPAELEPSSTSSDAKPNIEHSQRVNKSPITIPSNSSDNEEADLWDDSIPDNTVPLVGVIPADGVESFVTKFAKNYKAYIVADVSTPVEIRREKYRKFTQEYRDLLATRGMAIISRSNPLG
ncbi:hypothetical protein PSTT_12500 [Puccinia striiformis]|uniref:Uncharacterized protein n=1 Tax=Puccinia striiformis TaxID=27350 RepID=A0A2S4UVV0_9BASI|nr:hypothetical protein PSTT_12500 [Puccinia striiformis]